MTGHYDTAIIGGGIVGLAHAWMAVRRGQRVVLLEQSAQAQGASIRNFGMIWPIGQPAGELYALALRSRELWLELGEQGVLSVEPCGSLHLAHRGEEQAVLEEFCTLNTHDATLLNPAEVIQKSFLPNPVNLQGGLWSPTELRVNPRLASARIAAWLTEQQGIDCCFNTLITKADGRNIEASDGRKWQAEQTIVCSGSDLQTLFPEVFAQSRLRLCKLQMLKSVPQPHPPKNPPHIASGLTLRHYTAFQACPSLTALKTKIAAESPELDRFGIHVMASQFPNGEVILGDSHEYGAEITPFDNPRIDELILQELRKVIHLSDWRIQQRWHGIYAKHAEQPIFETETDTGVKICVGTGGAGMTMAFGLAERSWKRWMGES